MTQLNRQDAAGNIYIGYVDWSTVNPKPGPAGVGVVALELLTEPGPAVEDGVPGLNEVFNVSLYGGGGTAGPMLDGNIPDIGTFEVFTQGIDLVPNEDPGAVNASLRVSGLIHLPPYELPRGYRQWSYDRWANPLFVPNQAFWFRTYDPATDTGLLGPNPNLTYGVLIDYMVGNGQWDFPTFHFLDDYYTMSMSRWQVDGNCRFGQGDDATDAFFGYTQHGNVELFELGPGSETFNGDADWATHWTKISGASNDVVYRLNDDAPDDLRTTVLTEAFTLFWRFRYDDGDGIGAPLIAELAGQTLTIPKAWRYTSAAEYPNFQDDYGVTASAIKRDVKYKPVRVQ